MNKNELRDRMIGHSLKFDTLWREIVADMNEYLEAGGEPLNYNELAESMIFSGAWLMDRPNEKYKTKKSITKKIRKALGYTYP